MKRIHITSLVTLSLLVGSAGLAFAQRDQPADNPKQDQQGGRQDEKKADKKDDPKATAGRQTKPQPQTRAQQQQQQQDRNVQLQQQQGARLSPQRQKELVGEQQQRLTQYRQVLDQQQRVMQQQTAQLQQQKRVAQLRFQQDYLTQLRQQRTFLASNHPDYDRDPFFSSVSIYRYTRGGRSYDTNQYGADLLKQAVNHGYQEGLNAGTADRQDHWRSSYEQSYAYQDANYGYNGYYIERADYNYYFREGFRRGYDDGYSGRFQYGRTVNGASVMLDIDMSNLLGFQSIH